MMIQFKRVICAVVVAVFSTLSVQASGPVDVCVPDSQRFHDVYFTELQQRFTPSPNVPEFHLPERKRDAKPSPDANKHDTCKNSTLVFRPRSPEIVRNNDLGRFGRLMPLAPSSKNDGPTRQFDRVKKR